MDLSNYINALNEAKSANDSALSAEEFKEENEAPKLGEQLFEGFLPPIQTLAVDVAVKQIAKKLGIGEEAAKKLAKGDFKGAIKSSIDDKVESAKDAINDGLENVRNTAEDARNTVRNTVEDARDTVNNTVEDATNNLDEGLSNLPSSIGEDDFANPSLSSRLGNVFGDDDDINEDPFSAFKTSESNPFVEQLKSLKETKDSILDDDSPADFVDAESNESALQSLSKANALASRDADLSKFEPKLPRGANRELGRLENVEDDAQKAFDRAKVGGDEDEIRNTKEALDRAKSAREAKDNELEDMKSQQTEDFKSQLNDKYNINEDENLLESGESNAVEDLGNTAENLGARASSLVSESAGRLQPGYRVLADMMNQNKVSKMASDVQDNVESGIDNNVSSGLDNIGEEATSTAEKTAKAVNSGAKAGEKALSEGEKVGEDVVNDGEKVLQTADETSLADDWNPVGLGITLALTAGTVLAEIFGKKKHHNSPVPKESFTYQEGIGE